ncbi:sigma factor-like helix-turn-helix DNA-binding protein [Streptomyces californicus]|uniref:sigma factor-like helix-turn-helix DNA-binding protein n=1 Tax=Streptomyces californicus TaxID=67351 RepID=UPI0037AC499C
MQAASGRGRHPDGETPDAQRELRRPRELPSGRERDRAPDIAVDREAVKPGLHELAERERLIRSLRCCRDAPRRRVAECLGISRMYVSRLLSQSCDRLRADTRQEAA